MIHLKGNRELLERRLLAFLASETETPLDNQVINDWVDSLCPEAVVISSNHSTAEREVVGRLMARGAPVILVLARGFKKRWEEEIETALKEDRILLITPYDETETVITRHRAFMRNLLIVETADEIHVGAVRPGGMLEYLLEGKEYEFIG